MFFTRFVALKKAVISIANTRRWCAGSKCVIMLYLLFWCPRHFSIKTSSVSFFLLLYLRYEKCRRDIKNKKSFKIIKYKCYYYFMINLILNMEVFNFIINIKFFSQSNNFSKKVIKKFKT